MIDLYPSASPDILWSEEVAGEAGDGTRSKGARFDWSVCLLVYAHKQFPQTTGCFG